MMLEQEGPHITVGLGGAKGLGIETMSWFKGLNFKTTGVLSFVALVLNTLVRVFSRFQLVLQGQGDTVSRSELYGLVAFLQTVLT